MSKKLQPKIIVVVGPTASGKSSLAVHLAKKFNGEIISADSRQVYKGLDIGTEKITNDEMQGIPHHLIDVIDPQDTFTAGDFKKHAENAISDITSRGHLPIIAGGTGFYVQTIVDNVMLPEVPPNQDLRVRLEKKDNDELFDLLAQKDPHRAKVIDPNNKRRLVRALEIVEAIGKVPDVEMDSLYDSLQIGIATEDGILHERINTRLEETLKRGLVNEVQTLMEKGLSFERLLELGLEYRVTAQYLNGKVLEEDFIQRLKTEVWQYANRQKKLFKRDERILWFSLEDINKIEEHIEKFLEVRK